MATLRLRSGLLRTAQALMGLAVVFMTGWNAYIALRLRPDLPTA